MCGERCCDDVFLGDVLILHVEASFAAPRHPAGITHRENNENQITSSCSNPPVHACIYYATTNQKHMDVAEEEKEKRCDRGTERRGCYYIVLTAKEALGMQNAMK